MPVPAVAVTSPPLMRTVPPDPPMPLPRVADAVIVPPLALAPPSSVPSPPPMPADFSTPRVVRLPVPRW